MKEKTIFVSYKKVAATPMTRGEYNKLRGWVTPHDEDPDDQGYLVESLNGAPPNHKDYEGYISWSPSSVFEHNYTQIQNGGKRDVRSELVAELELEQPKVDSLLAFLQKGRPDFVSEGGWLLLAAQLDAMHDYTEILKERIALIDEEAKEQEAQAEAQ